MLKSVIKFWAFGYYSSLTHNYSLLKIRHWRHIRQKLLSHDKKDKDNQR